ncbi:zeta toxin family protein [Candidatus Kaiserbacteria bacterium]|nr:zeta toxin family protein [Candidatus Kaiserbacteria bacterium]
MSESDIRAAAIKFAKENKESIARELTDTNVYTPDETPVSIFMAGSPGAGKTEFSKALLLTLEKDRNHHVIRIDTDELRTRVPGYTGKNSYLFQGAVSIIAEKVHDYTLSNRQTFIFDGTLSKYDKAAENIKRSLDKKRRVFVFYVYQHPEVAWRFTEAREKVEGRNIPKSAFIEQFLGARETVERIREAFGSAVSIVLVKKDFEVNTVEAVKELDANKTIDVSIGKRYTKEELEQIL